MVFTMNSRADTFYDTSLTNPPGVYFGGGNANSNFTVGTGGGIELGLSVIDRFVGPIDPGAGSNVYQVSPGTLGLPHSGSIWGFDFSVNTQYSGGGLVLDRFTYAMTITDLTTSNTGPTFNPVTAISDDSGYGASGKTAGVNTATEWGAQNSESLSFAGFLPGFNPNAPDLYEITLDAYNADSTLADQVTVFANAGPPVPEPSSIILFGSLAIGVLLLGRKRFATLKSSL